MHRARPAPHSLVRTLACALALGAAGCPTPPPGVTVSAEIGAAGGAIAIERGVLVIPAGAVSRTTRFTITRLGTPPPSTTAITDLWRFEPDDLDLAVPARVTLPVIGFALAPMARWSLFGSTTEFEDVATLPGSSSAVTTERTRLGRVFCEARTPIETDAGMRDAPPIDAPPRDAPLPDVPRIDVGPDPTPPVTVGPDLRPADYSCLGVRTAPPTTGTPTTLGVRVVELLDGGSRASFFRASDELGTLGTGSTDSTGLGTLSARDGAWTSFDFDLTSGATDALTIVPQSIERVALTSSSSTRLEVVSQRTLQAIVSALPPFFETRGLVYGVITDCSGEPVQRARVRAFLAATGTELIVAGTGSGIGYTAGTARLPVASSTRSASDGLYFVTAALDPGTGLPTEIRLEVWGALTLGAAEERLGCEIVRSRDAGPVRLELGPTRADREPSCF